MNKKDKHINKYLHDAMPDPEIPADDAWAQMNDVLSPNSAGTSQSVAGKLAKYVAQFKWPLITALGGISVSILVMLSHESETIDSTAKRVRLANDSLKTIEVKPENTIETYGKTDSKTGNVSSAPGAEQYDTDQKADLIGQAVPTIDPVIPNNQKEIATIEKHVNVSRSHEKRISNVNKKPDLKAQTVNAETRQSAGNGETRLRDLFRSGKKTGSSNGSDTDNGSISNNRIPGTDRSGQHAVTLDAKKEYNVPAPSNASANIPSVANEILMHALKSLPFYNKPFHTDLGKKVKIPKTNAPVEVAESKKTSSLPIHIGLEWNLNTPFQQTDYLFTGTDSISRPARLLIPGIFISKNWANHTLSFVFSPYQPYFGNNKRVQQLSDTTGGGDSVKIYNNANLLKASGMNFTLQYQYQVIGPLLLNAGLSYSTFSSALIRKETENRFGEILQGPLVTVKKSGDLRSYLNPGFFALKAGLGIRPAVWQGRFQAGLNVILPLSNVSNSAENRVKSLNGQVYLRLMVR